MFQLINTEHKNQLESIAKGISKHPINETAHALHLLIERIRNDIPQKKKISYGRYSIIKKLGLELFPLIDQTQTNVLSFSKQIFENNDLDNFVRSLAMQLISIYGLEKQKLKPVLELFEKSAGDESWELRECSAGFIRKLIREHPTEMKTWYLKMSKSDNAFYRRFSTESIRPVADNKWFLKEPDFCFSILENMYQESDPYPRSSVGNSLSDWTRHDKERVYAIIEKLVKSKNKHSYWIAYRACRNLVKKEPGRVMDLLNIDEYTYKKRNYKRTDFK